MSADPFIGEIMLWPINFVPYGWAFCDGSLISIAQNAPLYSLLGTRYGGDGVNTFALPDLRGRVPLGAGSGPGLTPRTFGVPGGMDSAVFERYQLPELTGDPVNPVLTLPDAQSAVSIMPPMLAINYVIALEGYYPPRY